MNEIINKNFHQNILSNYIIMNWLFKVYNCKLIKNKVNLILYPKVFQMEQYNRKILNKNMIFELSIIRSNFMKDFKKNSFY